jgi:hypothetical protein
VIAGVLLLLFLTLEAHATFGADAAAEDVADGRTRWFASR